MSLDVKNLRIVVLGSGGQLGCEIVKTLKPFWQIFYFDREGLDITDKFILTETLESLSPHVVINAAAYTDVEGAESDSDRCMSVNFRSVSFLGELSTRINYHLIHFSSDYVFDGKKTGPYTETDQPNPLSVYGKSKWFGDRSLYETSESFTIFRTSWVFGGDGETFPNKILRAAKTKEDLSVVCDQIGTPTSVSFLSRKVLEYIGKRFAKDSSPPECRELYNLVPNGHGSWFDFARLLIREAKLLSEEYEIITKSIEPVSSDLFFTKAKRPINSLLDNSKIINYLQGSSFESWELEAENYVKRAIKGWNDE
jgi:dTDP-4-dehydrorhamnose reductase